MFRVYTEDIHENRILAILRKHFQGFTLLRARGAWKGKLENSLVIELQNAKTKDVAMAAREIKTANHQDAVMVTSIPDNARYI